jgi:hypothetical protein
MPSDWIVAMDLDRQPADYFVVLGARSAEEAFEKAFRRFVIIHPDTKRRGGTGMASVFNAMFCFSVAKCEAPIDGVRLITGGKDEQKICPNHATSQEHQHHSFYKILMMVMEEQAAVSGVLGAVV